MTQKITISHNKNHIFLDRLDGLSNKEIASKYKIPLNTVNDRFARSGKWCEGYRKFENDSMSEAVRITKNMLTMTSARAVEVLSELLESENPSIALRTAIYILDKTLGEKPLSEVKLIDPDMKDFAEEVREEIERAKAIRAKEEKSKEEECYND